MPVTTRSKYQTDDGSTEAPPSPDATAGSKHKIADQSESKRGKKALKKEQKTLEESINGKDAKSESEDESEPKPEAKSDSKPKSTSKSKPKSKPKSSKSDTGQGRSASSILEKGIIYFFFRGRVNIEHPSSVSEIARSYILLRPLPSPSDELTPSALPNSGRLLAVPKKTFPTSGRERWIAFVEKAGVSFSELKESFLSGDVHETKTRGTQYIPPPTPVGEGVYAITTTGRESHLCYILTIPEELGEVQKEMGLRKKGSFIISTRNPKYPPPGGAGLPEGPEFPEEIQKEFRSRRWAPTTPKHLDVEGAQILLVGASSGIEKATEPSKDQKHEEQDPWDELEKLEEEDEERMEKLSKDDSVRIFADLHASAKDFPKLQTTF